MAGKPRIIHGDDLLYRFFRDSLEGEGRKDFGLAQQLLARMAVWLPMEIYAEWPILLPWVVRDPSCRGNRRSGLPDSWASPDADGYLRDDNSLIKSLPRALSIHGPRSSGLRSARLGTDFVAAHVWRRLPHTEVLASRLPELNSFTPNLAWLPRQIAKLTDREGSHVQRTFQAMSWAIYRSAPVNARLQCRVEKSWSSLPEPSISIQPIDPDQLNWFVPTKSFFDMRERRLRAVIHALERLAAGEELQGKVITTRYTTGLPLVSQAARAHLLDHLTPFLTTGAAS
ncbi:hypothetical protein [Klenkia marina]|uniref:hypothetical protein n=1 Tax=Klenkia marina TaxID=1960309 RepID=UPI0010596DE9|nr:hypothetical protein [Klenkia marina]